MPSSRYSKSSQVIAKAFHGTHQVSIKVPIKMLVKRCMNDGAIKGAIKTALHKKAGVFISQIRPALGEVLASPSAGRHALSQLNIRVKVILKYVLGMY